MIPHEPVDVGIWVAETFAVSVIVRVEVTRNELVDETPLLAWELLSTKPAPATMVADTRTAIATFPAD